MPVRCATGGPGGRDPEIGEIPEQTKTTRNDRIENDAIIAIRADAVVCRS